MNPILKTVNDELIQIVVALKAIGSNDAVGVAHGTWNTPAISRNELIQTVDRLMFLISERGSDQFEDKDDLVADYPRRLIFLRQHTVPQIWSGNGGAAISAFVITIQGLQTALELALPKNKDLAQTLALATANAKSATSRLRALEASISDLEPRSTTLGEMLGRIESANEAADQLPVDLEALVDARKKIKTLLGDATQDRAAVSGFAGQSKADMKVLADLVKEADDIVARCSAAYAASTSHGLAAAFMERSSTLANSMWVWVCGLVVALGLGSWIGSTQLHNFSEAIKLPNSNTAVAFINLVLALLSVGATVWFSWLATKQIGQRFRLAEDYAFKASVSRAYEGYRREAANIDQEFVSRLFASALSRLDEQPLRLVETTAHGSPWQELASSELIKKASTLVPEFGASVTQLAKDGLAALKPTEKAVSTIVKAPVASE